MSFCLYTDSVYTVCQLLDSFLAFRFHGRGAGNDLNRLQDIGERKRFHIDQRGWVLKAAHRLFNCPPVNGANIAQSLRYHQAGTHFLQPADIKGVKRRRLLFQQGFADRSINRLAIR